MSHEITDIFTDSRVHSLGVETDHGLYESHQTLVRHTLDRVHNEGLMDVVSSPDSKRGVKGGHMEYGKFIYEKDGVSVFAKQHQPEGFTDSNKAQRSYSYLEKEAHAMSHVRRSGFKGVPRRSTLYGNLLVMDAMLPGDGWYWRAPSEQIDEYIESAKSTFSELEETAVPDDPFDIEPSQVSFINEGWVTLNDDKLTALHSRLDSFMSRLDSRSKLVASEMLVDLPALKHTVDSLDSSSSIVFCHHDIRQSNLAWHPEHGTRLIDWSWAGPGAPGSDITSLLIDLHKSGHDISKCQDLINTAHCHRLMGFWLGHSTWPHRGDDTVRFQQFLSAMSAYEILRDTKGG